MRKPMQLSSLMLPNKWNISSLSGKMFYSIEADTVITHLFTGRPAHSIRNRFIEKYLESKTKPLTWPLQGLAADDVYAESRKQNLADYYPLLAGQGLRLLK